MLSLLKVAFSSVRVSVSEREHRYSPGASIQLFKSINLSVSALPRIGE